MAAFRFILRQQEQQGQQKVLQNASASTAAAVFLKTAASLIQAAPDAHIYATLGNIANASELSWLAKKHGTDKLYFAADRDDNNTRLKALHKATRLLKREHNITSYMAMPKVDGQEKCDFNDVLLRRGSDTIKEQLSNMRKITFREKEPIIEEATLKNNLVELQVSKAAEADPKTKVKNTENSPGHEQEWNQLKMLDHPFVDRLIKTHEKSLMNTDSALLKKIHKENYEKALIDIASSTQTIEKMSKIAPKLTQSLTKELKAITQEQSLGQDL